MIKPVRTLGARIFRYTDPTKDAPDGTGHHAPGSNGQPTRRKTTYSLTDRSGRKPMSQRDPANQILDEDRWRQSLDSLYCAPGQAADGVTLDHLAEQLVTAAQDGCVWATFELLEQYDTPLAYALRDVLTEQGHDQLSANGEKTYYCNSSRTRH